ncbi:MAG TPA: oligoendopeptidase F, partial [candidate division Zixibacteria bacterium]|nr:oligoendopeptidase F [candidate division Zixibacteria bacterium]
MVSRKVTMVVLFALLLSSVAMAQVKEIPTRDQIQDKYKWNLADFFPSDAAWEQGLEAIKARLPEIAVFQSKLGESSTNLARCLMLNDTLGMTGHRLYVYAALNLDQDNRVGKYQEMRDKAYGVMSQLNQVTAFIEPEILKIPEEKLRSFIATDKNLAVYKFYLDDIIRRKTHIRSEEIEEILAQAAPVTAGPSRIFTMIDDADVQFPNIKDEKGNEIEMTKGRFGQIMESSDRNLRRRASETYSETYKKYSNALSATLASSVNGDIFYTNARGYKTCLERALDNDSIPESVFNNLIKATNNNLAPLHKYIALRKKALEVDTLFGFDLSVPIVPQSKMEFTYEQAKAYMLKGLKPLGSEYLANVLKALDSRWIDVYETQGKGSGGYTWGTYTVHPVMLINFAGTLGDVFTLAHEMGHMMHNYYSNLNEPYPYSGHSLFTAEVASTCNEAIMIKYMIDHTKDRNEKLYLLNYYIDQIIGTFYSQVWFSEYELKIHETVESGGALSTDNLRKFYREIFQKYYGPDL